MRGQQERLMALEQIGGCGVVADQQGAPPIPATGTNVADNGAISRTPTAIMD
jgi:hypothetical protein